MDRALVVARAGAVLTCAALSLVGCTGSGAPSGPGGTTTGPATSSSSSSSGASTTSSSPTSTATAPTSCSATGSWGVAARTIAGGLSPGRVVRVRIGQHACFDRIVIALADPAAVGVTARYVDVVHADPSDRPLPVAGGAVIQLTIQAAPQPAGAGPGTLPARVGDYVYPAAALTGWPSLRAVRLAGSFEAVTTLAIGVDHRTGFRLFSYADPASHQRLLVLDVRTR